MTEAESESESSSGSPVPKAEEPRAWANRCLRLRPAAWAGLAFLWAAGIFALSSLPGDALGAGSVWSSFLLNLAHAPLFGGLATLVGMASVRRDPVPILDRARMLMTLALVLAYAASDEWHQSAVAGRSSDVLDVFTDGAGALGGVLVAAWIVRRALGERASRATSLGVAGAMGLAVAAAGAATWRG